MTCHAPPLSIGLPVYNGQSYLAQAIDSLLGQTFGDFELLISDNASTDQTEEICREYAARDKRIRYERLPENIGAIRNFNRVFERNRSLLFKWHAHDDLVLPEFLQRCIDVLNADPDVIWCHSRSSHIGPQGEWLPDPELRDVSYVRGNPTRASKEPHQRFAGVLLGTGGCLDVFGVIRAEALWQTQLVLPYYGSEKVLMAELALRGRYAEVPDHLFQVRVHPEGSGASASAAQQQAFVDPTKRRTGSTRLGLLRGYVRAVHRAELPAAERARCYAVVLRYLLQVQKWKQVVWKALTGRGVGGGNVERLRRLAVSQHGPSPT